MSLTSILLVWPLMLLLIVILFMTLLLRGKGEGKSKYYSTNKRFALLYIYVGVLLIAFVVSLFLPSEREGYFVEIDQREYEQSDSKVYNDIYAGRISSVDKKLIEEVREVDLPGERLVLQKFDQHQQLSIVVERMEELGNSVEMTIIKNRVIANRVDLTDMFDPVNVTVNGEKMNFHQRGQQEVVMGVMEQGFPFYLFSDKSRFYMNNSYSSLGDQIIYLRVPNNIEIVYDENHIYLHEVERN